MTAEDALAGSPIERPLFDEPGEGPGWARVKLRVLVSETVDCRKVLRQSCACAGVSLPTGIAAEDVPDRDWLVSSQSQFDPICISRRLWIVPSWHRPPVPDAVNLRLDPGRAFGTGSHPTTILCLLWLQQYVRGGETVLDYGTGSGILAIAAMKLGAARAVGVDIDRSAVLVARENAERNGVKCEFRLNKAPSRMQADLLVANILANPLRALAPVFADHLQSGGRIALSGIIEGQDLEVRRSYEPWFRFGAPARRDGWVRLSGIRNSSPR